MLDVMIEITENDIRMTVQEIVVRKNVQAHRQRESLNFVA